MIQSGRNFSRTGLRILSWCCATTACEDQSEQTIPPIRAIQTIVIVRHS